MTPPIRITRISVLLFAASVLLQVGRTAAQDPDSIFFFDDYQKALQEAKLTNKPLFLEFRCEP